MKLEYLEEKFSLYNFVSNPKAEVGHHFSYFNFSVALKYVHFPLKDALLALLQKKSGVFALKII